MHYEEFRKAGHYFVDYIAGYLQNVEDKPLFPDVAPSFLYELFDESLPDKPVSLEEIQKLPEEKLIPYNTHFNHPAIWD